MIQILLSKNNLVNPINTLCMRDKLADKVKKCDIVPIMKKGTDKIKISEIVPGTFLGTFSLYI